MQYNAAYSAMNLTRIDGKTEEKKVLEEVMNEVLKHLRCVRNKEVLFLSSLNIEAFQKTELYGETY